MESNPSNDMMNAWFNSTTQMWKGWYDLMTSTASQSSNPGNIPNMPNMPNFSSPFGQSNQALFNPLLYSFNAWKDILNQFQGGQNWQQASQNYTQELSKQLNAFSFAPNKVVEDTNKLWQMYFQQIQKFNQLFGNYWGASINPLSQTLTGNSQPWIELNNLYWDMLYQPTLGNLLQSPSVGPTREFNAKLQKAFEAWTSLYRASIDSQAVLNQIQVRSFEKLMPELVSLAQKGEKVDEWRKFQQIWSRIVDDNYEQTFALEENLKIRGKLLNALHYYKLQQQELMEYWMQSMNMPLRSEVDEIHRNVYELRKEIKSLKKRLAAAEEVVVVESETKKTSPTKSSKKSQST
jgi:class III poly(R)-hydroxyalkanoic acid synthase PhaE subunit